MLDGNACILSNNQLISINVLILVNQIQEWLFNQGREITHAYRLKTNRMPSLKRTLQTCPNKANILVLKEYYSTLNLGVLPGWFHYKGKCITNICN